MKIPYENGKIFLFSACQHPASYKTKFGKWHLPIDKKVQLFQIYLSLFTFRISAYDILLNNSKIIRTKATCKSFIVQT